MARHVAATAGVRNDAPAAFLEQLSTHDPVTLFLASQPPQSGWEAVSRVMRKVASVYSGSSDVEFEVLAAEVCGDLAFVVGFERAASSVEGTAREELVLRVPQVYRREDGAVTSYLLARRARRLAAFMRSK